MANRNENIILAEFDNPDTATVVDAGKFDSISDSIRARLQVEVLLDCRAFLKDCKQLLQDIKANTA